MGEVRKWMFVGRGKEMGRDGMGRDIVWAVMGLEGRRFLM